MTPPVIKTSVALCRKTPSGNYQVCRKDTGTVMAAMGSGASMELLRAVTDAVTNVLVLERLDEAKARASRDGPVTA